MLLQGEKLREALRMERIVDALSKAGEWELLLETLRANGVRVLVTPAGEAHIDALNAQPAAV